MGDLLGEDEALVSKNITRLIYVSVEDAARIGRRAQVESEGGSS
jgi:hypothetical protein